MVVVLRVRHRNCSRRLDAFVRCGCRVLCGSGLGALVVVGAETVCSRVQGMADARSALSELCAHLQRLSCVTNHGGGGCTRWGFTPKF